MSFLVSLILSCCYQFTYASVLGSTTPIAVIYTDWTVALKALQDTKALWEATGINNYVYNIETSSFSPVCWIAAKYIEIESGVPVYAEYDTDALKQTGYQCTYQDLYSQDPLQNALAGFQDITAYYDDAIGHAKRGIAANCNAPTTTSKDVNTISFPDSICGGSITFAFHPTLYYPTQLTLAYGPFIADAGVSYKFNCLTPLNSVSSADLSKYTGTCTQFVPKLPGDNCGNPGTDCPACRGACIDCTDGSGNSYGCCSQCTLEENVNDELICSNTIQQDRVCPAKTTTSTPMDKCALILCASGYMCIDGNCVKEGDKCDGCVPCLGPCCDGCIYTKSSTGLVCSANSNACVTTKPTTTATKSTVSGPSCATIRCSSGYCCRDNAFGVGKCHEDTSDVCQTTTSAPSSPECGGIMGLQCKSGYECVDDPSDGCTYGTDPDCGGICKQETVCACTKEYAPYCCKGTEYGNECMVKCAGIDPAECTKIELKSTSSLQSSVCKDEPTTTTKAVETSTTATATKGTDTTLEAAAFCESTTTAISSDINDVLVQKYRFKRIYRKAAWACDFCLCNTENQEDCEDIVDGLSVNQQNRFLKECYDVLGDCAFENVGLIDPDDMTECGCSIFECKTYARTNNAYRIGAFIGFVFVIGLFGWM